MTATTVAPAHCLLTKKDFKKVEDDFTQNNSHELFKYRALSTVWNSTSEARQRIHTVGFSGAARRAMAMEEFATMLTSVFDQRFSEDYEIAFAAREIYAYFVDKLALFGVEDLRSEASTAVDETHVTGLRAYVRKEWESTGSEELRQAQLIVRKKPDTLTAQDVFFLNEVEAYPGHFDFNSVRKLAMEAAAIDRALANYGALSPDMRLLLGSKQDLEDRKETVLKGPRSGSFLTGWRAKDFRMYYMADELIEDELEARAALEESRRALAEDGRR